MRLALVILAVSNVANSRDFYCQVLDWAVLVDEPPYVELGNDDVRLGLYQRAAYAANAAVPTPQPAPRGTVTSTELYFLTSDPLGSIHRLNQAGAHPLTALEDRPWGDTAAYFADPDGNLIVVASPTPGTTSPGHA